MRTQQAPLIKLKNYSPAPYTIETVDLLVKLSPSATKVVSKLAVKRATGTAKDAPLVLDGDELVLNSVSVNGTGHSAHKASDDALTIRDLPKADGFSITIETSVDPVNNTKLMGLYQSRGVYCTQCEAEGFRRITYFLDRPDVLATYKVRIEADREECPILLSNGNPGRKGKLSGNRHFAEWHDPHPKPCYLFALVAGKLDALSDRFKTMSGRKVALNIYVEPGKAEQAGFAMDALKRSMRWDETEYGCEYDLDVFNIVAVSDFNMGAMENKGLNVFNDKYVLANPDLATDTDYVHIEAIIAHEYFHNWTGNRITCRDWFQLCLKEGLTVYRDQEFSADTRSRATQRIQQVRVLKAGQFPEDSGPLAHPVRPSAYREINNFYTATVYQKGAELVRMLATMVGADTYRKATDLYFKRHDGRAAVVEDFLECFEDASGQGLSQFARWYEQAGTPQVHVERNYDRARKQLTLTFSQKTLPTPGQKTKKPVPIPVRLGLLKKSGEEMPLDANCALIDGNVLLLDKARQKVVFTGVPEKPVLSLLRGFSAPVSISTVESVDERLVRAAHDLDPYNRWEAMNGLALFSIIKGAKSKSPNSSKWIDQRFVEAFANTVLDDTLDADFRAQVLNLPSVADVARNMGRNVDPDAVAKARGQLLKCLGNEIGERGLKAYRSLKRSENQASDLEAVGLRALKNGFLSLAVASGQEAATKLAVSQFRSTKNMTDRLAALTYLTHFQGDKTLANDALERFYKRYKNNDLALDKWFSLQATIPGKSALGRMRKLSRHAQYTLKNPNRARSLLGPFAMANYSGFHRADGKGYEFFARQIMALDRTNPQIAARLLTLMNNWKMFDRTRQKHARKSLQSIARSDGLSRDVQEIVDRMLS